MSIRFKGQGRHGCLFLPAPILDLDTDDTERLKGIRRTVWQEAMLGKIFNSTANWEKEWELAKRMSRIDPKQSFFIYPVAKGVVSRKDLPRSASACAFLASPKKEAYGQLVMPEGGQTLQTYLEMKLARGEKLSVAAALHLLRPCLLGVRRLIRHKWIHQDIKADNIVMKDGETRIIDFGLMIPFGSAYDLKVNVYMRSPYYIHPPEYRMVLATQKGTRVGKLYDEADLYSKKPALDPRISLWSSMTMAVPLEEWERAIHRLKESVEHIHIFANKVDLFSMGVLMAYMSPIIKPAELAEWNTLMAKFLHPDPRKRSMRSALQLHRMV